MSHARSASRIKGLAVALVVLCNLIWGWGYALVGAYLILVWADWLPIISDDLLPRELTDLPLRIMDIQIATPAGPMRGLTLVALTGVLYLLFGILASLAALGLIWRKPWGRVMTFLVAVLAVSISMRFIFPIEITTSFRLQVAQILYGILAYAVLSGNPGEPWGISIVRLFDFSVGLLLMLVFCISSSATESRFAMLISPSGFLAGSLLFASSLCLLISRWKRPGIVIALMVAAVAAEVALAASTLLSGLLWHSPIRGVTLGAYLVLIFFPTSVVLLMLTATGLWYLTRPRVRHALQAGHKPTPDDRVLDLNQA
jgi:hypothetical protein